MIDTPLSLLVVAIVFLIPPLCFAQVQLPSSPACDPSGLHCDVSPEDQRNCQVHRCVGVDSGKCYGFWSTFNDPVCEADKAAQNQLHLVQKGGCEVVKTAAVIACQTVAVSSSTTVLAAQLLDRVAAEATEIGMRSLPGELREGLTHLTKEAVEEIYKYPVFSLYLSHVLAANDPGLAREINDIIGRSCDAPRVFSALSDHSERQLGDLDKNGGILTTPLKRIGISGWTPTGCPGQGQGTLTTDAAHSSDGFWTVDVQLDYVSIGSLEAAPPSRFLRIELEPNLPAHNYAQSHSLKKGDRVLFGGPVVFDNDLPHRFLEVHPIDLFVKTADLPQAAAQQLVPAKVPWPRAYSVVKGDCLAWIAERTYGTADWTSIRRANARVLRNPDYIVPGWHLTLPEPTVPITRPPVLAPGPQAETTDTAGRYLADMRRHLDWAIDNKESGPDRVNCPGEYIGENAQCVHNGGRSCLLTNAIRLAKSGNYTSALRDALIAQCHNTMAQKTLQDAGERYVGDYLRAK